jgi:hypothetical protein
MRETIVQIAEEIDDATPNNFEVVKPLRRLITLASELRCDKCTYWRRLDYRCSVKPGAWSPDEFCSLWEAK